MPLTRFAPAPTGWLHLGHVLNAWYVWDIARTRGAQVLLRIEDHDRERCRPEYEAGILDDLDWLGFAPDIHPTDGFRRGACTGRQSDREEIYRAALDVLRTQGLVYACDCSRRTIEHDAPDSTGSTSHELRYSGRCRDVGLPLTEGYGWRVRMDPGVELFEDGLMGRQAQTPSAQCGDLLVRDRLGNWTYQYAVTVDDWNQEVDLVVRGLDLLSSTGRQIRLARLLGRERPPTFLHHPLIMKTPRQKLSKSDRDTGVRDLRTQGWTAAQVIAAARQASAPPSPTAG
jgi:glutamyl-tRNA synthetase/glutamyl-Q tRNA(Asp) synthetase